MKKNIAKKDERKKGDIIIYKAPKGPEIEVKMEKDTVWLDAHLIARLFGVNRPAIVKHTNNIYKTKELDKKSTCSILEQVAADGKVRKMNYYNLDMIISVGYRVNSQRATQFRIWATKTLKNHLIRGYTINEKRLLEAREKFNDLQETIAFLKEKSSHDLLSGQEKEIFALLSDYAKTLTLLEQYDKENVAIRRKGKGKFVLTYEGARQVIAEVKKELTGKKEAGTLFGQEYEERLKGIVGSVYQTFGGKRLYASLEEQAAHLLYIHHQRSSVRRRQQAHRLVSVCVFSRQEQLSAQKER